MPNILLVDTKSIESPKGRKLLIELDYELLDENLNPIGKEERIPLNPQIKSRTYKDGTVSHPKGEGMNKNFPTFREEYERIRDLLIDGDPLVILPDEESIEQISEALNRYNLKWIRYKFETLDTIGPFRGTNLEDATLVQRYREMLKKSRKEPLPSGVKMLEGILREIKRQYGINLSRHRRSVGFGFEEYPIDEDDYPNIIYLVPGSHTGGNDGEA